MPVIQTLATVVDNQELIADHRVITCDAPELARLAQPGHFVNVLATETITSILRKPFSVFDADPVSGRVSMLYQMHGATTHGMSRKIAGDTLDIVGPLGGSIFQLDPRPGAHHVMVGGGYGVPPLVFLCKRLRQRGYRDAITFIVGARSRDLLLCEAELVDIDVTVRATTEDGTYGTTGRVTDVLRDLVGETVSVYTCGPTGMMEAVSRMCIERGVACQVSLEVPMPCGVGVCMGCVVDLTDRRRVRACTEGPVFDAPRVVWK